MTAIQVTFPDGSVRKFPLVRPRTTLGRSPDNGIALEHPSMPDCALELERNADGGVSLTSLASKKAQRPVVKGKAETKATLRPGEAFSIGQLAIAILDEKPAPSPLPESPSFPDFTAFPEGGNAVSTLIRNRMTPSANAVGPDEKTAPSQDVLHRLFRFSEALLEDSDLPHLLELMMDQVIELTGAQRGYLLLAEGNGATIRVARESGSRGMKDARALLSESIVQAALETGRTQLVHDALEDPSFSQSASVMAQGFLSVLCIPLADKAGVLGLIYLANDTVAHRFDQGTVDLMKIWSAQGALILRNALLMNELTTDNAAMEEMLKGRRFGDMTGQSEPMQGVFRRIARAAPTDASILITGETGTGKELVAREIHRRSHRSKGPFVTINCGAIPENLLESELFGHVRGAFTGAVNTRRGKFQQADGGTLFLDEIGEMPLLLQVKILRAIQERNITKVGDNRVEPVDIRIVAATHRDLKREMAEGRFREDLYYRLNVVQIQLPPLRERGDDVTMLAEAFLAREAANVPTPVRGFTQNALTSMRRHEWRGNVRELENRLKKAVVLAEGPLLTPEDLGLEEVARQAVTPLAQAKEDFQRRYIDQVLEWNGGNRAQTAKDLNVDPRTIYRHLESKRKGADGQEDLGDEDGSALQTGQGPKGDANEP